MALRAVQLDAVKTRFDEIDRALDVAFDHLFDFSGGHLVWHAAAPRTGNRRRRPHQRDRNPQMLASRMVDLPDEQHVLAMDRVDHHAQTADYIAVVDRERNAARGLSRHRDASRSRMYTH